MFKPGNFLLWLHLTTIILWLGGTFFFTIILIPSPKKYTESPRLLLPILETILRWFRVLIWELSGLVFVTGIFNLINVGMWREFRFGQDYVVALAVKLIILAIVGFGQGIITYVLLPKLTSILKDLDQWPSQSSPLYLKVRRYLISLAGVNLLVGVAGVYIGLAMKQLI